MAKLEAKPWPQDNQYNLPIVSEMTFDKIEESYCLLIEAETRHMADKNAKNEKKKGGWKNFNLFK